MEEASCKMGVSRREGEMRDYFGMGYKQKHGIGNRKLGRSLLDHMGWIQAGKFS